MKLTEAQRRVLIQCMMGWPRGTIDHRTVKALFRRGMLTLVRGAARTTDLYLTTEAGRKALEEGS